VDDGEARRRFLLLAEELQVAAWIGLGRLKDPQSGEAGRNLELARHAIDTLGMLEWKTRGNRDEGEERMLRQMLADLRIGFVDAMRTAPSPEPAGGEGDPAPGPT